MYEKLTTTIQRNIEVVAAQKKEEKNKNKSVFTKVTHKLFKSRKPAVGTILENSQLNETNLHKTTRGGDSDQQTGIDETASISETSHERPATPKKGILNNFSRKLGGTRSVGDGQRTPVYDEEAALVAATKLASHMKIEVQRGQVMKANVLVYDIILRITSKKYANPVIYSTFQRYNSFKNLHEKLIEISRAMSTSSDAKGGLNDVNFSSVTPSHGANFLELVGAPFPHLKLKTYIGLKLNDSELSNRTRSLDAWLREICMQYRHMPPAAKTAVRTFLNFDMSRQKDIFVQDQLAWGAIDAPSSGAGQASVLIVQRSALDTMPEGFASQMETMSSKDGKGAARPVTPMGSAYDEGLKEMIWETATDSGAGGNKSKANSRISHSMMGPSSKKISSTRSVF